jgi:hypothetical protein
MSSMILLYTAKKTPFFSEVREFFVLIFIRCTYNLFYNFIQKMNKKILALLLGVFMSTTYSA